MKRPKGRLQEVRRTVSAMLAYGARPAWQTALAEKFGLSRQRIHQIVNEERRRMTDAGEEIAIPCGRVPLMAMLAPTAFIPTVPKPEPKPEPPPEPAEPPRACGCEECYASERSLHPELHGCEARAIAQVDRPNQSLYLCQPCGRAYWQMGYRVRAA